jgi:hypothetical protein
MPTKRELRVARQEALRQTFKVDDRKFMMRKYFLWGIAAALVTAGLGVFFVKAAEIPSKYDVTQVCISGEAYHIHPHLVVRANGQDILAPKGLGMLPGCIRPLHVHENDGIIHVENAFKRDFTLGEFFKVWGETLSRDQVLSFKRDDKHDLLMTVDGKPSDAWENLVLEDKQQIVITYLERK